MLPQTGDFRVLFGTAHARVFPVARTDHAHHAYYRVVLPVGELFGGKFVPQLLFPCQFLG